MNSDHTIANRDAQPCGDAKLIDILFILAKHWKSIVVVPFLVAVITAICSLFMPNIYTAKTMILPGDDNSGGMMGAMMAQMGNMAGFTGALGGGTTKADLYVTLLNSETLKDPIIDRYHLMKVYEAKFRAKANAALSDNSKISLGKKDGVITIAVDDTDPKRAAAIANAYVEELGKLTAALSMTGAGRNRVFLEERLIKANADLASAEDALKIFQSRNKAVAVTDQAKTTLEGVALLRAQLVAQEIQLANLKQQFSPESREIRSANQTIGSLRAQIVKMEGSGGEGTMPGVSSMPQLGQEYIRLMREFKVQETLVELLTKQYEMTKLNESKDLPPFQVLQQAKIPELKSKPSRSLFVLVAALVSGALMVAAAFIWEIGKNLSSQNSERWQELRALLPSLPTVLRWHPRAR